MTEEAPVLAAIRIYPVKALDGCALEEVAVLPSGALAGDRRVALLDAAGGYLNGKRCEALHRLRARWEGLAGEAVRAGVPEQSFDLDGDSEPLAAFVGAFLGRPVRIARDDGGGFPDDRKAPGPTVVGRSSLEAVGGWFGGLPLEGARRRFRANLEIAGVPAFWEDRLFGAAGTVTTFRIGEVVVEGTNPCARCVVPPRDPDTGEALPRFAKTFAEQRRATLPPWAEASRFDHFYRLAVNTRIDASQAGKRLRIGDPVRLEPGRNKIS